MKDEIKKWISTGCLILAGIFACRTVYFLIDYVFNGLVLDWFSSNFMIWNYIGPDEQGNIRYSWEPDWYGIKVFGMLVFTVGIILLLLLIRYIVNYYNRKTEQATVTAVSQLIQRYMGTELEATEVFPSKYAEVSVQMAEIKSVMKRNEQVLKEEARRKNDLITYLAHDLKTPLTSVIGYLSLLDEIPEMPMEQRAKYVRITVEKAKRLEKLINEFFEITRYNLQQMELEKEQINLSYMLQQMADEFYPLLKEHGNSIALSVEEELTVYGDSMKLARVFNNILKNAVAYSYPDTVITLSGKKEHDSVCISFENKGKTISEHHLKMIFEKFFRMDEARGTNTGGAGLGLAIAKEIVESHGGSITAESRKEHIIFRVCLPLS